MNTHESVKQAQSASEALRGVSWKAWLRFAAFTLLLPMVLFIAAGRLNWVMGWVYVGSVVFSTLLSRVIVMRTNPDLLAERAQSLEREDVKGWDRMLLFFLFLLGLLWMIVAGLDERFGWSPRIPLALQLVALVIMVLGYVVGIWAMVVNRYFSAVVRIQKDRGQTAVTDGPYRFVRHPAYATSIVSCLATPILLGSLWALIPSGLVVLVTVIRTALEDKTLLEELDGYVDYARRVRYRLLPGVW
ncbi:MAG: isoprenylcysteine carboxylmethyltransferase family protein [Chloroflexi bacterium]|nr:isoprenylcysteine carboxylmethyltransferase family protein [Chloroflexota bacterium]